MDEGALTTEVLDIQMVRKDYIVNNYANSVAIIILIQGVQQLDYNDHSNYDMMLMTA